VTVAPTGRLSGKVALVTGAGSGLGEAIAFRFAREGARVAVSDVDMPSAIRVAERIGPNAFPVQLDVTIEGAWTAAVDEIRAAAGKLNILINNAGVCIAGSLEELSKAQWDLTHRVNVDSVFYGARASLPLMRETTSQGETAAILNISSISSIVAGANMAAYNSSKAAVHHLTKSIALHCARDGGKIRCNSLHPAFVDTPLLDSFAGKHSREDTLAKLAKQIPIGRVGIPDDVAMAAIYLCSDEATFVTGAELKIDGGLSAA
jgi:NAD(P)-dependent dehydrogenase (short-subunit alcohol dehydrogenase family)